MAGYKSKGKSSKRVRDSDDEDAAEVETKQAKTTKKVKKAAAEGDSGKDGDGNPYWTLSGKRRVTISEFKKQTYINLREYWVDDSGEWKPGKKGISLSLDQYNTLLKVIPTINAQLVSQGLEVTDISGAAAASSSADAAEKTSSKDKAKKANIEATSDEEEEEEEED